MNGFTDKTHSLAQYIAACIGIVFFGVAFLVLGAILPILTQEYNLDNVMSSTLAGILPSAILAGSLLFGPIIDRYGYKLLMIVASILGAAGLLIIATAGKISIVMAGIACMGLSGGFLNGATNALASDVSTDRNRDRNLMLLGLFYCGGAILTTYLIPAFAETYPYRKILSAAAAIMFASCLYYIFIRFPKGKCAEGIPVKKVIALLKHPVLLILSISLFFQSALEGITGNRVSQYLIEMESFSLKDAGIALSFVMIGLGIGRLVNSFILKYVSKPFIITSGMIIAMCGITILMNAQSLHQWIGRLYRYGGHHFVGIRHYGYYSHRTELFRRAFQGPVGNRIQHSDGNLPAGQFHSEFPDGEIGNRRLPLCTVGMRDMCYHPFQHGIPAFIGKK